MSKYEEYISNLSDSFKKLEASDVLSDFADFNKKYSDFLDFYDEKFGKNENPEYKKVLEELGNTFTEKREKLLKFFSEQTRGKDIAGLFKDGKLDKDARSFILTQVDNHLMVTPAQPIIPSDKDLESFYRPLYNKSLTTTKLELNSVQIQACALAGLDLSEFENNDLDTIKAAWEKKGFIIENGFVFRKGANAPVEKKELRDAMHALLKRSHPDKHMENEGYYQSLFELVNNVNNELSEQQLSLEDKKNKNTELAVIQKTEIVKYKDEQDTTAPQPKPAEHTDLHWIDEKIRDYTEKKNAGDVAIKEFSGDKTAGTFTAEIDNGTITYTSPNDVSVTKDSSYKVFDTMMKEPSNAGKIVCLPEDATAEFRTNLFVAAVLNGYKVSGAEGFELDKATLAKIDLDDTQKAQVRAALQKQEEATQEKTSQEKPSEEKPSEKVTENEPLPGPYNPAQHRINHVLERSNMLAALANGGTESVKSVNPDKPTFIFKNAQNPMKKGGRDE